MDYYKLSKEPLQAAISNKENDLYLMYADSDCQATLEDLQNRFGKT